MSFESVLQFAGHWWWVAVLVAMLACYKLVLRLLGVVIIPDDKIGLVTKKFVLFGEFKELPAGKIVALNGEAGIQAYTLAPGLHFFFWPWQYIVEIKSFVVIPSGKIGVVESCDGKPLPDGRILGCEVQCDNFQDARAFLSNGGERGPQSGIIPPGTWRINTNVFTLEIADMTVIPQGKIGVVESCDGKPLPAGRILGCEVQCENFQNAQAFIANGGERGPQMSLVPPGTWRINPFMFSVKIADMTVVSPGKIGVVEARDGKPLSGGRVLGKYVECDMFQSPQKFLENGGERGPQMRIVPQGQYRINPLMFAVSLADVTDIPDNMIGVVTAKDGAPLPTGEIAGDAVEGHDMFQNPQAFIDANGSKGLQQYPLLAGRYFLNPRFATVEQFEQTRVPIANVGVVIAYVGKEGKDLTGDTFKHGNLVSQGEKGVWIKPLDPGKYPVNPHTHKVELVPTANIVLNWATGKTESHKLDQNLSTITVRSSDGFTFNLDVSQIIHIPSTDAPKVIARFGSVANLVTQVLEPTIGNYFRRAAQKSDAISFLKERGQRQDEAKAAIEEALKEYNVVAVDTLIGDITPPEALMKTLTDRKIAEQERVTYDTQREAEEIRKELAQAKAMADTQPQVVAAERKVSIAEFDKKTAITTAEGAGEAAKIKARAEAEAAIATGEANARVIQITGEAEGKKITAVGEAEAAVIQKKTDAMDTDKFAMVEVARALAGSGFKLVPDVIAGGGDDGSGGIVQVLMAGLLKDSVSKQNGHVSVEAGTAS